ncbi:MAG: hypothetical protein JW850_09990 [Thermoflexales bacterium]|nr:hypothetical protein [Thermoflexales bacterium]
MENLLQSIAALQTRLAEAGFPSAVIGGIAVGVWGDPRVTRDADLKVLARRDQAGTLWETLGPDYTAMVAKPLDSLRRMGFVFVQDCHGTRLDLLLADTPYDEAVIQRGRAMEIQPGITLRVCSAEDLVIYKMISSRPRDRADVEGIVRRQGQALDDDYILGWLRQFEPALDDSTLVAEYTRLRKLI